MAADSGRPQRGMCSRAHGKRALAAIVNDNAEKAHVLPRTREASGPSDTSYRVAKCSSDRSSARRPYQQVPQWHPRVSKERESAPLTGLWSGSRPGLARRPCLQMPQWHPRVAKRASDRSLARSPCPQVLQSHPGVAKGAANGALIGVKAGNRLFLGIGFKLIF